MKVSTLGTSYLILTIYILASDAIFQQTWIKTNRFIFRLIVSEHQTPENCITRLAIGRNRYFFFLGKITAVRENALLRGQSKQNKKSINHPTKNHITTI